MKKIVAVCMTALLLLSACGSTEADPSTSPSVSPSPSLSFTPAPPSARVPATCEETGLLELVTDTYQVKNAQIMNVPYQPKEGTAIYTVLSGGGKVCDIGSSEEQKGLTVAWFEDDGTIFDSYSDQWESMGYKEADIPGVEEVRGMYLYRIPTSDTQAGVWSINMVVDGVWIQAFSNFIIELDEGQQLIDAFVNSIRD